jgi:hypothetical protein
MSIALYHFASPFSIFRQLRLHQWRQPDLRILVPHYGTQYFVSPPREGFNHVSVECYGSECVAPAIQNIRANKNWFSMFSQPCTTFCTFSRPSDQTLPESVTSAVSDVSSAAESSDNAHDDISATQNGDDDWWTEMEPVNSVDGDDTDNVGTFDNDVGAAGKLNDAEATPEILDYLSLNSVSSSSSGATAKAKVYSVARSLKPPDTTIYHRSQPTYFQWDYRNHRKMDGMTHVKLLGKIEQALKDAHLEPFGKRRGVRTVRRNILLFNRGTRFRLAQTKSFVKRKTLQTYKHGSKIPSRKFMARKTNRLLQTGRLLKTMFQLIYERHTIRTCKHTAYIGSLDRYALGESFFGPTTHISMTAKTAKMILRELWLHGRSRTFTKMQNNHNVYQAMLKRRIRAEWLNQY